MISLYTRDITRSVNPMRSSEVPKSLATISIFPRVFLGFGLNTVLCANVVLRMSSSVSGSKIAGTVSRGCALEVASRRSVCVQSKTHVLSCEPLLSPNNIFDDHHYRIISRVFSAR